MSFWASTVTAIVPHTKSLLGSLVWWWLIWSLQVCCPVLSINSMTSLRIKLKTYLFKCDYQPIIAWLLVSLIYWISTSIQWIDLWIQFHFKWPSIDVFNIIGNY